MPKLRAVRTKEEAELVPANEAVEIVLPAEGEVVTEPDPEVELKPDAKKVAAPTVEIEREPDPEASDLKARLAEALQAQKLANDAVTAAQERERTLARERDTARQESTQHQQTAEDAKYVAIVNALNAAKSEAESATRAWAAADAENDPPARAEANRRLVRAEANVARYEESQEAYEAAREARKTAPAPVVETTTDPVERAIANMPDAAKTWLRSHPDYITDVRKNAKLQATHYEALDDGHPQFSPAYFEALETRLGLRRKAAPEVETDDEQEEPEARAPQPRSRVVPSAPPTRDAPQPSGGKAPNSTRITLTPEQREMAKLSGVDELTYARGVIELNKRKREGHYQERG